MNSAASQASRRRYSRGADLTYWHRTALRMFREGANTLGIAKVLKTTEGDAYGLLSQAREMERASRG